MLVPQVSQSSEEIEDLRRRLRGVEMDLKLVMEGGAELGGQEEVTDEPLEERGEEEDRGEHLSSSLCPALFQETCKVNHD